MIQQNKVLNTLAPSNFTIGEEFSLCPNRLVLEQSAVPGCASVAEFILNWLEQRKQIWCMCICSPICIMCTAHFFPLLHFFSGLIQNIEFEDKAN
jgi:hypothetical protein